MIMRKKRILSVLMIFVMVIAMAATGCGKKEEPKVEEEVSTDDKKAEDKSAESSTNVSNPGELTDEKMEALYASIKESVKKDYLEPNNISPSEFQWPAYELDENGECQLDEAYLWTYLGIIYMNYSMEGGELYDATGFPMDIPEKKGLMDSVLTGIASWHDIPENSSIDRDTVRDNLGELYKSIPENVKFDE